MLVLTMLILSMDRLKSDIWANPRNVLPRVAVPDGRNNDHKKEHGRTGHYGTVRVRQ